MEVENPSLEWFDPSWVPTLSAPWLANASHANTYDDVRTIRASTPMFLISRKIKSLGVKMIIPREGSDGIFGGYIHFRKAPNKEEFHYETCHKGSEARVPFSNKEFIDVAMVVDPEWKMMIDKMMQHAGHIIPHNTPTTREAYYYRMIFERLFPQGFIPAV
ncbi:asparagine synthetase [Tripterygium wilfordii]|uniref:Asparagine synthetase n=1 Tax=Tripterygium wilfordii TaxID=458696 RepID=A0A7J7C0M9_TRIWF|nr:asparagine synthetase [Tripterygium wilfordii]